MTILLIMLVLFVVLGISALISYVTMSLSLFRAAGIMWYHTLIIVCCILLLPFVVRYLRAVCLRLRFSRQLKHACRRAQFTVRYRHNSLLSLFFPYKGTDIFITAGQRRFAVKFFPGNVLRRRVHLRNLTASETSKFYVIPVVIMDPFRFLLHDKLAKGKYFINKMAYGRRAQHFRLSFEEGYEPVLLFSPTPLHLTGLVGNAAKPLGSGELYEGVTLYEDSAWIRFLARLGIGED